MVVVKRGSAERAWARGGDGLVAVRNFLGLLLAFSAFVFGACEQGYAKGDPAIDLRSAGDLRPAGDLKVEPRDPFELFARCMQRSSHVNVVAIIKVADGIGKGQTMKMVADHDGHQRMSVLLPLDKAGLEILLLGDTTEIYEPDSGRLHVTPSPGGEALSVSHRERLLKKNYDIILNEGYFLAGVKAVRLTAKSHYPEMGSVDLYVDPETLFVLRLENTAVGQDSKTVYETLHVEYPESLPEDAFRLKVKDDTMIVKDSVPIKVSDRRQAKQLLGTTPLIPRSLPLGFQVTRFYFSETQMRTSDAKPGKAQRETIPVRALDMEVSDGIATATIHEIPRAEIPDKAFEQLRKSKRRFAQVGNLILVIRGDLGPRAQDMILDGFKDHHSALSVPTHSVNVSLTRTFGAELPAVIREFEPEIKTLALLTY